MPVFQEGFSSVTSRPAHCIGKTSLRRDPSDDCAQPCRLPAQARHRHLRRGSDMLSQRPPFYCVAAGGAAAALECVLKLTSMVT